MTRHFPVAAVIVAASAMIPSPSRAQAPPPPPNVAAPHPSPAPAAAQASAPVTLTGCLERSTATSAPTRGKEAARAEASPSTAYVLRTAPTTTSGSDSGVVYNVISASKAVKLEEHVGHRVEITATMRVAANQQAGLTNQGVSPSTPSGSTGMETLPKPDPGAPAQPGGPSVAQPLFVESLKMLEGSCKASTE